MDRTYILSGNPNAQPAVVFSPNKQNAPIGIIDIWGPHGSGGSYSFREALDPRWKRDFKAAGAEWFYPFLTRLAEGEDVALDELQAAYRQLFGAEMTLLTE